MFVVGEVGGGSLEYTTLSILVGAVSWTPRLLGRQSKAAVFFNCSWVLRVSERGMRTRPVLMRAHKPPDRLLHYLVFAPSPATLSLSLHTGQRPLGVSVKWTNNRGCSQFEIWPPTYWINLIGTEHEEGYKTYRKAENSAYERRPWVQTRVCDVQLQISIFRLYALAILRPKLKLEVLVNKAVNHKRLHLLCLPWDFTESTFRLRR